MSDIDKVILNGYCIGCGACQVKNNINTLENNKGMYLPDIEDLSKLDNKVCPISNKINELTLSKQLYSSTKNINYGSFIVLGVTSLIGIGIIVSAVMKIKVKPNERKKEILEKY